MIKYLTLADSPYTLDASEFSVALNTKPDITIAPPNSLTPSTIVVNLPRIADLADGIGQVSVFLGDANTSVRFVAHADDNILLPGTPPTRESSVLAQPSYGSGQQFKTGILTAFSGLFTSWGISGEIEFTT